MGVTLSQNGIPPFLRWAGGKSWLIKYLAQILNETEFQNYHEPFLGGGAIFFSLQIDGEVYLSDLSTELIEVYTTVRDDPDGVIAELRKFQNTPECYYDIRGRRFRKPAKRAARFIFLNQTSFNGLYRVNKQGIYNVPYGFREKQFLEPEKIRLASQKLQVAQLSHGDFATCQEHIQPGDLVFLDPPYTVSHNHNGFIKYNQQLFSIEDQRRLSQFIDIIKRRRAYYILTNAAHEIIDEIFHKNGDYRIELNRASLIGGENAQRGQISEYIFTNIEPRM